MLEDASLDAEMRDLAEEERRSGQDQSGRAGTRAAGRAAAEGTPPTRRAPILEIRAGTGGDEAGLVRGAICSACTSAMPRRTAGASRSSRASDGTAGGYKEIVAEVEGAGVFAKLKFESVRASRASACPTRRPKAASTLRPPPSLSYRRPRRSTSTSTRRTSRSTRCAPRARAASTSTRPSPPSASRICRAAW